MFAEKEDVDISYETISDLLFNIQQREKKKITDRLKNMSEEEQQERI